MSEPALDRVEWRVLGAIQVSDDVTNRPLRRPVDCSAPGVRLVRNSAGLYVITEAPGLAAHVRAFDAPPAAPAPGAAPITLRVDDPLGEFLPRLARIPLPRSPAPGPGEPDLFVPERVAMLPAPSRTAASNWSSVRVSAARTNSIAWRGALVELRSADADARLLGRGLTDERGEAIVTIAGLPLVRASDDDDDDDITTPTTPATIAVVVDPAQPWPVDPDRLAAERATLRTMSLPAPIPLAAGGTIHRTLTFDP